MSLKTLLEYQLSSGGSVNIPIDTIREYVIEEIVGDIKDEFDFEKDFQYKKIDSNTFVFLCFTSVL